MTKNFMLIMAGAILFLALISYFALHPASQKTSEEVQQPEPQAAAPVAPQVEVPVLSSNQGVARFSVELDLSTLASVPESTNNLAQNQ